MKMKHIAFNYHIDITPDLYIEYKSDVDEDTGSVALSDGVLQSELWIVNSKTDEKWLRYEDFLFDATDKRGSVFDVNFYQALKKFRKTGIPEMMFDLVDPVDCRWLYYEREFYAVLPVLLYWRHASLRVNIAGTGSDGREFTYEFETGTMNSLSIDDRDKWRVKLPRPEVPLQNWLDGIDDFFFRSKK
ncbi:MAG: hypothetical protein K5891_06560 [Lachnospiraceae bacterium]|nr:hypothetical protein [Lachnospiraceae bacterium]